MLQVFWNTENHAQGEDPISIFPYPVNIQSLAQPKNHLYFLETMIPA